MQNNGILKFKKLIDGNKNIFLIIVAILLTLLIFLLIFSSIDDSDKVTITAEGIVKNEKLQELEFIDISLTGDDEGYVLSMGVVNHTDKDCDITDVDVVIKDKNGKELVTLPVYFDTKLTPEDKILIEASTPLDLSKAYTKEIIERKEK